MIDHKTVLNTILANDCPQVADGEHRIFWLDLHCNAIRIEADHIGDNDYEITDVQVSRGGR